MKIASLREPSLFEILDDAEPVMARDEVLLRVAACGVCTSELDMWRDAPSRAAYPWYPGTEVSRVPAAAG